MTHFDYHITLKSIISLNNILPKTFWLFFDVFEIGEKMATHKKAVFRWGNIFPLL